MFLQHKTTGDLIEILKTEDLSNPCLDEVMGQSHAGEEMQDSRIFSKNELIFPSGESLPQCWLDENYRESKGPAQESVKVAK